MGIFTRILSGKEIPARSRGTDGYPQFRFGITACQSCIVSVLYNPEPDGAGRVCDGDSSLTVYHSDKLIGFTLNGLSQSSPRESDNCKS